MTLAVYFEHIQKLFNRYYYEIVTIGWDLFRFKFIRRQIKYLSQDMYIYIYIYIYIGRKIFEVNNYSTNILTKMKIIPKRCFLEHINFITHHDKTNRS